MGISYIQQDLSDLTRQESEKNKGILRDTVDGQNPAPPRMMIIPHYIYRGLTIPNGAGFISPCFELMMNSHLDAMEPMEKRRRIDGSSAKVELEVLNMCGECILKLNVSDSIQGRDLWTMILDKLMSDKPGLQLVVSHNTRLVLNESLKQQGLGGERAQVSATYMPINLFAALRFAHGYSVVDEEFSLNGTRKVRS